MPLPRLVRRTVALVAACAAIDATITASPLAAQNTQPHPDIPDIYQPGECHAPPFPAQLPPLDSVVDSTRLATALKSAGVDKALVFGLRLGALATVPRARVIQKMVSGQVADRALREVDAALRVPPTDRDWAFRLRVEVDPDLVMTLERSEVCAAVPGPRGLQMRTFAVPSESLAQIRREAEDAAIRRRALLHRVLVDAKGHVVAVELVHSSGDATMDEKEATALQRRGFNPTKLDGLAVSAWVVVSGDR